MFQEDVQYKPALKKWHRGSVRIKHLMVGGRRDNINDEGMSDRCRSLQFCGILGDIHGVVGHH